MRILSCWGLFSMVVAESVVLLCRYLIGGKNGFLTLTGMCVYEDRYR